MNEFESLLQQADDEKVRVFESFDLNGNSASDYRICGLYMDCNIALDKDLHTTAEKACVLAEALGHHYTSTGNIIELYDTANRKQEFRARLWAYNRQIGLHGLISAYKAGCQSLYEIRRISQRHGRISSGSGRKLSEQIWCRNDDRSLLDYFYTESSGI